MQEKIIPNCSSWLCVYILVV